MTNKALFVSKHKCRWHDHFFCRISDAGYESEVLYLDCLFRSPLRDGFIAGLQRKDKFLQAIVREFFDNSCDLIIYDLEFSYLLTPRDIQDIRRVTNVSCFGLCFDDDTLHSFNRVFYSPCDGLLVNGPLPQFKYQSYGFSAMDILPIERPDTSLLRTAQSGYSGDYVLHFGCTVKGDRQRRLDLLRENGINVIQAPPGLSFNELYAAIAGSLFVLTFSRSDKELFSPIELLSFHQNSFFAQKSRGLLDKNVGVLQAKGRLYEIALCGALSVTEYFPLLEQIYPDSKSISFQSDEQLLEISKKMISDRAYLNQVKSSFSEYIASSCSPVEISQSLRTFLARVPSSSSKSVPRWSVADEVYARIVRVQSRRSIVYLFVGTGNSLDFRLADNFLICAQSVWLLSSYLVFKLKQSISVFVRRIL